MRKYLFLAVLLFGLKLSAQELNCVVFINHSEIGVSNKKIFDTMQNDIFEYMNNTKWTDNTVITDHSF